MTTFAPATYGPKMLSYSTTVVTTVSGHERRNANWAAARGKWNVAHGLKKREQVAALIAFFRARRGRAYGFRFKDWTDYQALAQLIGQGDGATKTFQLAKAYASGAEVETRIIAKPVSGTVKITLDGVEAVSGWSVDGDRARHLHHRAGIRRPGDGGLRVRRAGALR